MYITRCLGVSKMYLHGTGKVFNFLKMFLLSVRIGTCFIILIILLCSLSICEDLDDDPYIIIPYEMIWENLKLILTDSCYTKTGKIWM